MYKLQSATLGIVNGNHGKPVAITIPADSVIEIVGQESESGTIDVLWTGQRVNVFAVDLENRCTLLDHSRLSTAGAG